MNPMLIRFELFSCGIQMKKPETQYIQIAFTQLTISYKVNIIYYYILLLLYMNAVRIYSVQARIS